MKSVCPFCNSNQHIKWGKRRRKCGQCERTFRVKLAGRKKSKKIAEMYLLDRSTYRRIGIKLGQSHNNIIRREMLEIKNLETPTEYLKKI